MGGLVRPRDSKSKARHPGYVHGMGCFWRYISGTYVEHAIQAHHSGLFSGRPFGAHAAGRSSPDHGRDFSRSSVGEKLHEQ